MHPGTGAFVRALFFLHICLVAVVSDALKPPPNLQRGMTLSCAMYPVPKLLALPVNSLRYQCSRRSAQWSWTTACITLPCARDTSLFANYIYFAGLLARIYTLYIQCGRRGQRGRRVPVRGKKKKKKKKAYSVGVFCVDNVTCTCCA